MGVLMGFVVGYVLGARAGREGLTRLAESVQSIAASPEFQGLAAPVASFVGRFTADGGDDAGTDSGARPFGIGLKQVVSAVQGLRGAM